MGIDDFIKMASDQLGISNEQSRQATGGLLGFLKDQLSGDLFGSLASQISGTEDVAAESAPSGGGGLMGSLASAAGSLLGGNAGDLAKLTESLSGSGLSLDKIGGFVGIFTGFLREHLDGELLEKILGQIPALSGNKD